MIPAPIAPCATTRTPAKLRGSPYVTTVSPIPAPPTARQGAGSDRPRRSGRRRRRRLTRGRSGGRARIQRRRRRLHRATASSPQTGRKRGRAVASPSPHAPKKEQIKPTPSWRRRPRCWQWPRAWRGPTFVFGDGGLGGGGSGRQRSSTSTSIRGEQPGDGAQPPAGTGAAVPS